MKEQKMHWVYLLCGGFIIGTICSLSMSFLWSAEMFLWRTFGIDWRPYILLRRCWGYW